MTPNGLPGICRGCGQAVVWTSRHWRNPTTLGRHACPLDRPRCDAWMPLAKDRCARRGGHADGHKTRWAMDNQLAMVTGRRKAIA
jgi:hypothetical protein